MRQALLRLSACAALLVALYPARVGAESWDRLTYFTFSRAVQLPGITLEPGTYEFRVVNPGSGGTVLRVASPDGKTVHKLFLMMRGNQLDYALDEPAVVFRETPAGVTPALQGWYYPGEVTSFDFVYTHRQREALAMAHDAAPTLAAATMPHILVGSRQSPAASAKVR